jgi:Protein of unknown function with PCYCGC motif
MRTAARLFLPILMLTAGVSFAASLAQVSDGKSQVRPADERKYHDHLPAQELPVTLGPAEFKENRSAFAAYTLAAGIKTILYQVPCYCGCDKERGHESLLDCFTSRHGVHCPICQKEVFYCDEQATKRHTAAWIREQLEKGKSDQVDLAKSLHRFYSKRATEDAE